MRDCNYSNMHTIVNISKTKLTVLQTRGPTPENINPIFIALREREREYTIFNNYMYSV